MACGLQEVLVDIDDYQEEESGGSEWKGITVEIHENLVEKAIAEFSTNVNIVPGVERTLRDLAKAYNRTHDRNEYFGLFGEMLARRHVPPVPPGELIRFMQRFFPVLMSVFHPGGALDSLPEPVSLCGDEVAILDYVGGSLLRRVYYHRQTSDEIKTAVMHMRGPIRVGSIAEQRNRILKDGEGRLWGISESCREFFKIAEMYFRRHVEQEPTLRISGSFFDSFLNDPSVVEFWKNLDYPVSSGATFLALKKLFKKFITLRADSYSCKLKIFLQKQEDVPIATGIRKYLKTFTKN